MMGSARSPAQLRRQHDRDDDADIGGEIAEIMGLVGGDGDRAGAFATTRRS